MNPRMLVSFVLTILVSCALSGCTGPDRPGHADGGRFMIEFADNTPGQTPAAFEAALTGEGGPVAWVVQPESGVGGGKNVLVQTSADETKYRFPLCIYRGAAIKDVRLSVRFKPIAGKVDRAGGLVARFQDKGNYYVVRANALEDNVRLYKVEGGKRIRFAGCDLKVASGQWHTLGLEVKGSHFRVFLDGKQLFEADDRTFADAGRVGLWTKSDSVTCFDRLEVTSFDANPGSH